MANVAGVKPFPQLRDAVWLHERMVAGATYTEIAAEVGCTRQAIHNAVIRHGIDRPPRSPGRPTTNLPYLDKRGYLIRYWSENGVQYHAQEHRLIMAEIIGRPLLAHENVHHMNGVRDDNRPENLELWSTSQPSGQRAKDKVKHARYILSLYGDMFLEDED